jgi:hypothetical protein
LWIEHAFKDIRYGALNLLRGAGLHSRRGAVASPRDWRE